ncbi:MAG TPA: tRNA epoxyqueuosine(34) reductase QueG [Gemmatimonadales bacterium]|nr:tRNA epoxyqueuosine(34) reductase QueG [Gemmatimonadales bacterium]
MSLARNIKARAGELGFVACGITHPGPTAHGDRLDQWLAKGYAGTMRYLHRQARRRKDPGLILPEALSVVVVLDNYYTPDEESDRLPPRIAKYARGEDYHRVTRRRLDLLAEFLRQNGATLARSYVDAGPVPERELAQRAGLGWIGKNTMLVSPVHGSFVFIGSVFTDLALPHDEPFEADRCGSCTRCLDACPTEAFVEPRMLDATRCISYLTIEQKGPIPQELAGKLEGYAFGCDICNDVCPWNHRFAQPTRIPQFGRGSPLAGKEPGLYEDMTEAEFAQQFGHTPLERAGLRGMRRNFRAAFS